MKRLILLFTFLLTLGFAYSGFSQDWDYEKYPKLDVDLQHLDADIRLDEFGTIQGDVLYRALVNIDDPDSLVFDASRLSITLVSVNDTEKDFTVQNDRLIIYLDEAFAQESVLNIRVQYEANPRFGVLRDTNRTTWTSQLPKSNRHWLPVIDHPRVQFTTELVFTYPSGNTMVATGRNQSSGVVNVDEERSTFTSNNPVPASAIGWLFGDITEVSSVNVNRTEGNGNQSSIRLSLYSESDLDIDSNVTNIARNSLQTVQDSLGASYPYQDLNIVVLDNDFWETKSYAAGMIFVYQDHGDIEQQIQRGILSQWIGTLVREEQWVDADAILVCHSLLANQLFDFDYSTEFREESYDVFSPYSFSKWEHFLNSNDNVPDRFKTILQSSLNDILNNSRNVLGWNELSEIIYDESGQPFFDGFEPGEIELAEEQPVVYTAEVDWNESENTIQLNFKSIDQSIDELVTVYVSEVTFEGTREHEVTFTGESESSVINVSSGIENLQLRIENRDDIELIVEKPFMFWIYQLRNNEESEERAEAAKALAEFTDNPDLQLALNDILRAEANPEVYAEIVRSLSRLTTGASGTHERFLEYSSQQQHPEVRKAAIEALAYFQNNERVISRLQNVILESENPELQRAAIRSLAEITEADRFNSIAGNLVSREPVLHQVPVILRVLAEKGEEESAVEISSTFIAEQFPYAVRKEALEIILKYDRSSGNWESRLPELFTDAHPGIRYRAASAFEFMDRRARNTLLKEIHDEEYDERVRRVLESYL